MVVSGGEAESVCVRYGVRMFILKSDYNVNRGPGVWDIWYRTF